MKLINKISPKLARVFALVPIAALAVFLILVILIVIVDSPTGEGQLYGKLISAATYLAAIAPAPCLVLSALAHAAFRQMRLRDGRAVPLSEAYDNGEHALAELDGQAGRVEAVESDEQDGQDEQAEQEDPVDEAEPADDGEPVDEDEEPFKIGKHGKAPEPEPATEPERAVVLALEAGEGAVLETEPEAEPESELEPEPESGPEAEPGPEPEPELEAEPEPASEPEPQAPAKARRQTWLDKPVRHLGLYRVVTAVEVVCCAFATTLVVGLLIVVSTL